ncbi:MAG: DUF4157 domain-containing protein [Anaerolineae bacterium]
MSDAMDRAAIRRELDAAARHKPADIENTPGEAHADDDPTAMRRAVTRPDRAVTANMLALQRGYGNSAVQRLIQAKLTVGPPDDMYEWEADRVADQVTGPSSGPTLVQRQADGEEEEEAVQTKPAAGAITPLVQREGDEDAEDEVQTKRLQRSPADGGFEASSSLESRLSSQKGSGSPLPDSVRSSMEPRFGADFGDVRIHTGSEAVQMNREVSAQAFTHGHDIYMGEGKYSPDTSEGQHLLAHELTHVVQQTGAGDSGVQRQAAPEEEEEVQRQAAPEEEEEEGGAG